MMNCRHCNKELSLSKADRIKLSLSIPLVKQFCSRDCKERAKKKRRKENIYYISVPARGILPQFSIIYAGYCTRCQEPFVNKRKVKYCSKACTKANQTRDKEKDRLRHYFTKGKGVIKDCVCPTCSTHFQANHKRKYCNPLCNPHYKPPFTERYERVCLTCNQDYKPHSRTQKYCSRACNPYGKKYKDPFYQTKEWKQIRAAFMNRTTRAGRTPLSNQYCIECYQRTGLLIPMYAVDHIIRRRDGGSDEHNNLQSLCLKHHQSKSATERNSIKSHNSLIINDMEGGSNPYQRA